MKILVKQSFSIIFKKYQFALNFLAFHSLIIISAEIHIGLHNSAVAVKNTTTLHCRDAYVDCSDQTSLKTGALWSLRMPGAPKDVDILEKFSDRISMNATCIGQYDLTIKDVKFEDAGTYYCTTQQKLYTAQLIVLDSQLRCHASLNESDDTVLQCTVDYKGNWSPTMKWRIVDGLEMPSDKVIEKNQRVTSTVKRSMISQLVSGTTARYSCEIFFDSDYTPIFDSSRVPATNIPAYHHVWISQEIRISSRNIDDKKHITTHTNDYQKTEHGIFSNTPDNKIALTAVLCVFGVLILLVIITVTLCKTAPKCRLITTESVDPRGIPTQIDDPFGNENQGTSNMKIIDEVGIFQKSDTLRGFGNCQTTMSGPERIYENTLGEAHYMNIENDQPEQLDDELIQRHYISLETETKEALKMPSTYRRLVGQKSRRDQPEPLNADPGRPIYINTIAL